MSSGESLPAWPYCERNGVGVERDVETLLAAPEIQLDDADAEAARVFARDLLDGRAPAVLRDALAGKMGPEAAAAALQELQPARSLPDVQATSVVGGNRVYYTGYLETPAGVTEAFAGPGRAVDDKTLASRSLAWYKQELTARVMSDPSRDDSWPETPVVYEHVEPHAVLGKFRELQQFRRLYGQVRQALQAQPESDLRTVQRTHLEIYQARVNELTAALYPTVMDITDQVVWQDHAKESEDAAGLRSEVVRTSPIAALLLDKGWQERREFMDRFAWRMDYIRNGAARQPDGTLSPVSAEVAALADELDRDKAVGRAALEPSIAETDIAIMRETRWDATTMVGFLKEVLREWGELSEHEAEWEEVEARSGRAPDGKVQVAVFSRGSLEAISSKLFIGVPAKFDRPLLQVSPAGALAVGAHELKHIDQALYEGPMGEDVPLLAMGGARYSTMREACGIAEERKVHAMVGQERPTGTTYLRAMQAKVEGGSPAAVARAWAEAHGGRTPAARALAAGKNVLRLYRHGRRGGHDSEALSYSEQALIDDRLQRLPEQTADAIRTVGGMFSLPDLAKLRRAGLLQLDAGDASPRRPAEDVMRIYLERYHRQPDDV